MTQPEGTSTHYREKGLADFETCQEARDRDFRRLDDCPKASRYRHSIDGENPAAYRPFRLSDDESIGRLECTLSGLRLLVIAADDADVAIGFHVSRLDIAAVLQPLCAEFRH